jgi:hypothetical protein
VIDPARLAFEVAAHAAYRARGKRDPFITDLEAVAIWSRRLARQHFRAAPRGPVRVQAIEAAARFVYATDHHGWSYQELALLAPPRFAGITASIFADVRLALAPHHGDALAHLAAAPAESQVIRLAVVLAEAEGALERVRASAAAARSSRSWCSTRCGSGTGSASSWAPACRDSPGRSSRRSRHRPIGPTHLR